jgi:tetratricopeptide (TPR) repeat protein
MERTLGREHPSTLISVGSLALLYKSQGRYDEAEPLFLRALEASEHTLGHDHLTTNRARYAYALALLELKRNSEAASLLTATLGIERTTLGDDHPDLAMTYWNLARTHRRLLQPAEAAVHRAACWRIESQHDGAASPGALQTAVALVGDLLASHDTEAAHRVAREALDAVVRAGDHDPERQRWVDQLRAALHP